MDQVDEENCGAVTSTVVAILADRALRWPKVIFWADSRRRIRRFRNVIIKPNQFEAAGIESPLPEQQVAVDRLCKAVGELRRTTKAPICVTRGTAGILASDPEPTLIAGVRLQGPTDPTGAGESVTAAAVLALSAGASLAEAALMGNLVASITVQQLATTGVARPEQLGPRLQMWLAQRCEAARGSDATLPSECKSCSENDL
jgi:bifunctional ADP-heptose synthase (sugar kinase/adenylyltransferase)